MIFGPFPTVFPTLNVAHVALQCFEQVFDELTFREYAGLFVFDENGTWIPPEPTPTEDKIDSARSLSAEATSFTAVSPSDEVSDEKDMHASVSPTMDAVFAQQHAFLAAQLS
jgi:hypothetical protein